jgi:hypothetical protein
MTLPEMFDTALSTRTAIQPPRSVAQVKPKVTEAVSDFEMRQEIYSENATDSRVDALASDLGVSSASLRALGIGWCVTEDCWTFPEFNGRQQLCGIVRRFRSGEKRSCKGGHRGLTLPHGWNQNDGPLYICEGQSDVAAAISNGMNAIGRPGLKAGLGDLVELLQADSRHLIVVADNDSETKGHKGATELATHLGLHLKRKIQVMAPPVEFKDLRQLLTGRVS